MPVSQVHATFPEDRTLPIKTGLRQGLMDARMHATATLLMGGGCLLMNLIPGLKMRWGMAVRMALANMGLINLGLVFVKSFRDEQHHAM